MAVVNMTQTHSIWEHKVTAGQVMGQVQDFPAGN